MRPDAFYAVGSDAVGGLARPSMNRDHGRIIPVPNLQMPRVFHPWIFVLQPQAYVAEKWLPTNRIGRHFARIKAAASHPYRLWLLRKTGVGREVRKRPGHRPERPCRRPFRRRLRDGADGPVRPRPPARPWGRAR